MSRVHVRFIKEKVDGISIIYRVDSSDFNTSGADDPIARITIDRNASSYNFEPLGELSRNKVVPPHVYDLPQRECEDTLREQYDGFGYGGWTSRIAKIVRRLIVNDDFPDEVNGVT